MLSGVLLAGGSAAEEPVRGPVPEEQRVIIRLMAMNHEKIDRSVELIERGYRSRTTSDDPEVAAALIAHVRYMKTRMDSGGRVRNWDPAFREIAAYHDRIDTTVRELANGLEIEAVGKDLEAAAVARNHARIVSGFAAEGSAAVQRTHEPVHGQGRRE